MAQLAAWSIPKPKVRSSNRVVVGFFFRTFIYWLLHWKGKNEEKEAHFDETTGRERELVRMRDKVKSWLRKRERKRQRERKREREREKERKWSPKRLGPREKLWFFSVANVFSRRWKLWRLSGLSTFRAVYVTNVNPNRTFCLARTEVEEQHTKETCELKPTYLTLSISAYHLLYPRCTAQLPAQVKNI